MKTFLLRFIISTLFIFLLFNLPHSYAQSNTCVNYYNFEDSSSTRAIISNNWEITSGNPHTGNKSYVSRVSNGKISNFKIIVKGSKTESVDVYFWFRLDKEGRLLLGLDGKQEFIDYTDFGKWQRFRGSVEGATEHTLTWTLFSGPGKNATGQIDDICIRNKSCGSECPEGITEGVSPIGPTIPNATSGTLTTSTIPINNVTNYTNISVPLSEPSPLQTLPAKESPEILVEKGMPRSQNIFPTIQSAIDNAPPGATIEVVNLPNKGAYEENITINKSLKLISDSNAVIQGTDSNTAFNIEADNVTIKGFKILNTMIGIQIGHASKCNISGNSFNRCSIAVGMNTAVDSKIENNSFDGSLLDDIRLIGSSKNLIKDNWFYNADEYGVMFERSDENNFTKNTLTGILGYDIYLKDSNYNNISNNDYQYTIEKKVVIDTRGQNNTIDLPNKENRTCDGQDLCVVYKSHMRKK
jgi:parallel beta-helix repeat protein